MDIKQHYDLTELNTFGISARAKFFAEIHTEDDLKKLLVLPEFQNNKKMFLGGGSNILFTKNFDGLVILNKLKGIEIIDESPADVTIRSMSGVVWHELVLFAVEHGYWGIENLSFIPGTVGAAPMQNIGAYGAELKNVLENVKTFDLETGLERVFKAEECQLGYRDSVFKNNLKGKYFIFAVTLKLSKIKKPNVSYKILKDYLEENKIGVSSSKDISDAVTHIRKSKLPDPKVIHNAGSFFKNVFVTKRELQTLVEKYPHIPSFQEPARPPLELGAGGGEKNKIPAAWLIEQCGPPNGASWKGQRVGKVGVHEKHALVLVNYGGGNGQDIKNLAEQITNSVFRKFGLKLVPEVNFI